MTEPNAAERPARRVADVWANHWTPAFFEAYPPMGELYERVGITDRAELDESHLIAEAKRSGVERVIVSATDVGLPPQAGQRSAPPGNGELRSINSAVAAACAEDPDRLVACASLDPRRGLAAVRELRCLVGDHGFAALKVLPFLYDLPPNDRAYYPLYTACAELGIPVLVLTGHTAVLRPNETGRPNHLDDVALFFPELTIVAGHAGYPWTDELIGLAWKHERLFIDTSGHRPKHFPPQLVRFMATYGSGKMLFGTGWPMMDPAASLGDIDGLGLRDDVVDKYLWSNAAGIWGWS